MGKFIWRNGKSSRFSGSTSTQPQLLSDTTRADKKKNSHTDASVRGLLSKLKFSPTKKLSPTKSNKATRPFYKRKLFWLSLGLGGSAIALGAGWLYLQEGLPDPSEVLTFVRPGTLTIKAANGTILDQEGEATYETLKINQIPPKLIQAFIAAEDRRFYQHSGVDYQGVLRAVVANVQAGGVVEGGSSLTQQLARIVFLDQKRNFGRKFKEMLLAQKMEQNLSKEQILERYLNLVYLGSRAHGVADAAWVYFSKPVKELTLPEMATLAGLAPAPSEYSPLKNKQKATERRNLVLQRMKDAGFITVKEAEEAIATPLTTKESLPKHLERHAPYFTDYIQKELPKYVKSQTLAEGGLTVETTLNPEWQTVGEEAIKRTVQRSGRYQNFKNAALVAIDPRTGEIKTMVGGDDFNKNQFNNATQAQRQPGSTFKTFVYTTAIAAGVSPYRSYLDAPFTVDGYTPKNFTKESFRGWLSIRQALTSSINTVAVKTLIDVGWNPVIQIAQKMGIESKLHPTYSLALGASEVNLLELTSAYGTIAAKGMHSKAHGISRIIDRKGQTIYQANFKPERAIGEDTSAIMTWLLRGVVTDGTGGPAALNDRPVAGKTGTSDEARDLWFVGYIPQLVTGVWLGNDNNKPTWGASSTAASTWNRYMRNIVEGMPVEKFPPRPDKIEGRKAEIKKEPIKPRYILNVKINSNDSSQEDNNSPRRRRRYRYDSNNSDNTREERRSRRRRSHEVESSNATPREERRYRRRRRRSEDNNSQAVAPRQRRRSILVNTQAAPTPSAPRQEVEPAGLPPAPPAERR